MAKVDSAPLFLAPLHDNTFASRRFPASDRKSKLLVQRSHLRFDAPEFVPVCAPGPFKVPSGHASSASATDSDHSESLGDSVDDEDVAEDGHTLSQNYLYHRYVTVLEKALSERAQRGPGNSSLVASLYPFWVTRLTHKFNRNMYRTFTRLAVEDAAAGDHVGMDALYRFFCSSLRSIYRERLFRDFVQLVAAEAADHTPGVEMLWLFMKDKPSAEQDALVQCYPDLVMAMEQLEALSRFSLDE